MWTHGIKRIAGSTIVAGALLATALASHAQAATPCKAACLKNFRTDTKACVVEGNCADLFGMCRNGCIESSMPGPERSSCLSDCRAERISCRQDVAGCKADAVQVLNDCKDGCTNND
jgi:hypothetical protein